MTRNRRAAWIAVAFTVVGSAGTLLSGCTRAELTAAPELVPVAPRLFANGPGAQVSGSPGPDNTAGGPLWWFTAPEGVLEVFNGSDQAAMVRVSADVFVPCESPAQLTFELPSGHRRTVDAAKGRPGRLRFAVRIPARGAVDVPVQIEAPSCQPPNDPRTLYAGLLSLRARAAAPDSDGDPQSSA
jgi:hypothetical protein